MLRLRIEGPDSAMVERAFADTIVVGRADLADVHLDGSLVSRRHARFYREGDAWFVEDLGSRNGTSLNGVSLRGAAPVHSGDIVQVGDTVLRVQESGPGQTRPAGTTAPPPTPSHRESPVRLPEGDSLESVSILLPAQALAELVDTAAKPAADVTRDAARLRVLNEVHRALATSISLEELLDLVLERAAAVLAPEDAAIFLREPGGELRRAAERRSPSSRGELLVSRRLAEEVTEKGSAALVLDAARDERFSAAHSILMSGVRSILAAPIADAEGCLGMIALYSSAFARHFSEEDLQLLVSIASAAALRIRNVALAEEAAERRLLERELSLAAEIQMAMLTRSAPARPEIDLAATLRPARTVGGDLYDFFLDGDRLWFVVGDVAGKGIAAALFMAVAKTLFRAIAQTERSLASVVARVNAELCRDNDRAVFVTAFAGWLDLATGELTMVNAGHNPPYLVGAARSVTRLEATRGVALGVLDTAAYSVTSGVLPPGDGLVLYTDGVTEAIDPAGQQYSTARLEECLRQGPVDESAPATLSRIVDDVMAFAGTAPQEDDITVLVLRYRGTDAAADRNQP